MMRLKAFIGTIAVHTARRAPVTDFDAVHRRYWRDNWANREAAIPVRGGDIVERGGRTYAVLFDADRAVVAVYQLAGAKLRLIRVTGDERAEVAAIARQARR
jgi:hypothetical protein